MNNLTPASSGVYYCTAITPCGAVISDSCLLTVTVKIQTGAENTADLGYKLLTAKPNPISDNGTISFIAPRTDKAILTLTNELGMEIADLYNDYPNVGENVVKINLNDLQIPQGVYYVNLKVNGIILTEKMVVVK